MGAVSSCRAILPPEGQRFSAGGAIDRLAASPLKLSNPRGSDWGGAFQPTLFYDASRRRLGQEAIQEKGSREEAEKRAATLEAQKEGVDEKWCADLESKQAAIANLQTHHSKQAATILNLKEEVAQLRRTSEGLQREAVEWKSQVEELESKVEVERLEKLSAQEDVQSERLALQSSRAELDESKAAYQAALANAQSLQTRLGFTTSKEVKKEIIEEYRQGPLGKVKLSLAVKAVFDYLKVKIPSDASSLSDITYPSRVQNSLSVLRGLEERGAGVELGVDDGDEDDDDEDEGDGDENEEDNEGGGSQGGE